MFYAFPQSMRKFLWLYVKLYPDLTPLHVTNTLLQVDLISFLDYCKELLIVFQLLSFSPCLTIYSQHRRQSYPLKICPYSLKN